MASIGKRRKGSAKKTGKQVIVIGRKRKRSRKMSGIGATTVKRKKKKRSGFMGSTGVTNKGELMHIVEIAGGVAVGYLGTHFVLRPLEKKLVARFPAATKFLGAAETIIGGLVAVRSKKTIVKSVGLGILANGISTIFKQAKIYHHNPAVSGADNDMTLLHVPINGSLRETLAGLIDSPGRYVRTPIVGEIGDLIQNDRGATYTPVVGEYEEEVAGLTDEERDWLYSPRG